GSPACSNCQSARPARIRFSDFDTPTSSSIVRVTPKVNPVRLSLLEGDHINPLAPVNPLKQFLRSLNHLSRRLLCSQQTPQLIGRHGRHSARIWMLGNPLHVQNGTSASGIGIGDLNRFANARRSLW